MKYCPFCNWEIVKNRCSNYIQCCYNGSGVSRESIENSGELGQLQSAYDYDWDHTETYEKDL